jgi:hypothetical protein
MPRLIKSNANVVVLSNEDRETSSSEEDGKIQLDSKNSTSKKPLEK